MRRALLFGAAVVAVVVAQPASPPRIAAAQAENRAGVVVDLGDGDVRKACIVFTEASVTGLDVLRAARTEPVVQQYSGQGGAVCALCGLGCPAGSSCLTCKAPDYWQYWRADNGAPAYTYSRAGAGSVQVTDGDVEGWIWGSSQSPPPLYSVSSLCSDPSVPTYRATSSSSSPSTTARSTTTTTPAPSPSTTTAVAPGSPAPTTAPPPSPAGTVRSPTTVRPASPSDPTGAPVTTAVVDTTTTAGHAPSTSTTAVAADGEDEVAAAPRSRPSGSGGGSSAPGYVAFAALLAGLGGMTVRVRRRRTPSAS